MTPLGVNGIGSPTPLGVNGLSTATL